MCQDECYWFLFTSSDYRFQGLGDYDNLLSKSFGARQLPLTTLSDAQQKGIPNHVVAGPTLRAEQSIFIERSSLLFVNVSNLGANLKHAEYV